MSILRTEQIKHKSTGRMTTNLIDLFQKVRRVIEEKENEFGKIILLINLTLN